MRTLTAATLALAAVAATPSAGWAQPEPRAEVGVGYSFLRIAEADGLNLPAGWTASAAAPVNRWLSGVGEFAGNYRSEGGAKPRLFTYQVGVRATARLNGIEPFAQFLAGGLTVNARCSCGGSQSVNDFVVEPGGGVDLRLTPRTAVRVAVGFPVVFSDGDHANLFRFQTGVVIKLGGQ